jgi:hypothetical protein
MISLTIKSLVPFRQRDRHPDQVSVRLNVRDVLVNQRFGLLQDGVRVDHLGHRLLLGDVRCLPGGG